MSALPVPTQDPTPSLTVLPPPAPAPTAGGMKKVSFGGIAKKTEKTKTAYPVAPDENGELGRMARRILTRTAQLEALEGALETDKAELKQRTTPFYFQNGHGKVEVPSSVSVLAPAEEQLPAGEVLISFQNRYKTLPDESPLLPLLGERTGEFFTQSFVLKVDGDKLPEAKVQDLMTELQDLFARYQCTEALSVTEGIKPKKEFHAKRHLEFSPEVNVALDQVCSIVAQIKTKGRKAA